MSSIFEVVRPLSPITTQGLIRTWRAGAEVIKCLPLTQDPLEAQLPVLDGVQPWGRFERLSKTQCADFELPHAHEWVLAARDFIDGTPLIDIHQTDIDPALTCLRMATVLRDLHELGVVHGDLHPGNVILNDELWLIDVALFPTASGIEGHVHGNPTCMAPEAWHNEPATPKSDVYALGCVFAFVFLRRFAHRGDSLSKLAASHRDGLFDLSGMPSATAALVRRMLSQRPEDRPTLSEIILGLEQTYSLKASSSVVVRDTLHHDAHAALRHPGQFSLTCRDPLTVNSFLDDQHLRLELDGWQVVDVTPALGDGPWKEILKHLAEQKIAIRLTGDMANVVDRLWSALLAGVPSSAAGLCVIARDFEKHGPDFHVWWSSAPPDILQIADGPWANANIIALEPGSLDFWRTWRANTLRSDVRSIAARRFDELAETSAGQPGALKQALDQELGHTATARILDTQNLRAIGPWRKRAEDLLEQCAFGELAAMCQTLVDSAAQSSGRRELVDLDDALTFWTHATIRGARRPEAVAALINRLNESSNEEHRLLLAQLLHALGRHTEGLDALDKATPSATTALWQAQLSLSSGQSTKAKEFAEVGLTLAKDQAHAEQLRVFLYAGDAMSGDPQAISQLEELTERLARLDVPSVLIARAHAYMGIGLTRNGQLERATDCHLRALELVEAAGLFGELPTYLLNAGTAYHKQGRLGLAREHYARGIRTSGEQTRPSTKALLLANQANIDLALGRLDEAEIVLDQAQRIVEEAHLVAIGVMCASLRADLMVSRDELTQARDHLQTQLQRSDLSTYQHAELELSAAEVALRMNEWVRAEMVLDDARERIHAGNLSDLEPHQAILRARMQWAVGGEVGVMAGIETFRRSLQSAQKMGNHKLVLRQAPFLLQKLEHENLSEIAEQIVALVHESRNIVGMGLTRELRREFFSNLATPMIQPIETKRPDTRPQNAAASQSVEPFYRMLSLNELILKSPSLDALMPEALDIAMTLSGAERGFILLREPDGQLVVKVSRDVDGSAIAKPHLEVSTTIAEEAARTGQIVVTLNAQEDARFNASRSIHTLELTSVLCVPVRDGTGLLGAIYLDHRYSPGVFMGDSPRMMEAFGHQVALAITNARRIDAMEVERQQLREAQTQLAELLSQKEEEVVGLEERVATLQTEVERERSNAVMSRFPEIIARSRAMEVVLERVERVAHAELPVVIYGESGVGKELIARAIHANSDRRKGPFIPVNCGAVTDTLLESELFGHKKGAFTGADSDRVGLLKAADSGTVFLDEIGEMPASMQVKLLRVIQERKVRPVGSNADIPIDVRIIAATHRDLRQMSEDGDFREDLYYRIAPVTITIPPLRERPEDIALIAQKLLSDEGDKTLSVEALRLLAAYRWPGNVRELQNVLRAASVFSANTMITAQELRDHLSLAPHKVEKRTARGTRGRKLKLTRSQIQIALKEFRDNRQAAADALGVSLRTLYRYLERWDDLGD